MEIQFRPQHRKFGAGGMVITMSRQIDTVLMASDASGADYVSHFENAPII